MASNNSLKDQQWVWTTEGSGQEKNVSSQSHQSEVNVKSRNQQAVIHKLQDMFLDVLELEIIQSVAQNCEFNLHASIEALMMLSDDVDIRKSPLCRNALQFLDNTPSSKSRAKKLNIPELPMKAKPRKEARRGGFLPVSSFGQKSQAVAGGEGKPSSNLSTIRVTYKSPDCLDSDSDADVVIEEENQYDVARDCVGVNSLHGAFSRLQIPSGRMQPVVPLAGIQGRGRTPPKNNKSSHIQPMTAAAAAAGTTLPATSTLSKQLLSAYTEQQKQTRPPTIPERVQKLIREGTRVMVLMRGASGSGKSHLAVQMVRLTMGHNCNPNKFIFSTDDFFLHTKRFIPALLHEAHSWNQKRVRTAAQHKLSPIFIDNTNTELWEMEPYAEIAVGNGYVLELLEPSTPWRYHESQLAQKNVHNVPRKQIENMLARFEKNLTGKSLLAKLKLKYPAGNKPPQPAVPPPQMKQKKKALAPPVMPPEAAAKPRKRRRKCKGSSQQPAQDVSLMDTLTVFLARKVLEEGQMLDPQVANSHLSNGITVGNALLPKKQDVSSGAAAAARTWTSHDSVSSEGSVVNTCGLVDMGSQVDNDSSSGDESVAEVEGVEDDNDSEIEIGGLGEWQVSDNDWLYQSGDDGAGEESNGTDNPEPVTSGTQCWEYILITENSEWIYQKHHPEAQANPETSTEQVEGLLINLSADSTDSPVNVQESARETTSTENLLIDIFSRVDASLESGTQQLLSPVSAPPVAQTDSHSRIPSRPFSLAEFDQWLCPLPVEPETEALLWQAPSSEKSKASSDFAQLIPEEPVRPAAEHVGVKTVEPCPLALANSSNEENLVLDADQASGMRPESTSSIVEACRPVVVPSADTRHHPETAGAEGKEDQAVEEVGAETGTEDFAVQSLSSHEATEARDSLTKCSKGGQPDVCAFMVGKKPNQSSDVGVPDTEPAVSWQNEDVQQGECSSLQRSIFVSEEVSQVEQGWSGLASFEMQNSRQNGLTEEVQKISFSNAGGKDSDAADGAASRAVTDTSTNTHYKDFILISQLNRSRGTPEPVEGVRIVTGHNCNISEGVVPLKHIDRPVPVKLTLDKSSMATQEDDYAAADKDQSFAKLVAMFPNAPQDAVKEIFEKCYGDLNWSVDLLLESKLEELEPLPAPEAASLPDSASYSEDTLRMRKLRHGEPLDMGEVTTKPRQSPLDSSRIAGESTLGAIGCSRTRTPSPTDMQKNSIAQLDDGEMIPFELDPGFVAQLHQMFGNPSLSFLEDVRPVVNLPVSLARQIHYYLVESQLMVVKERHKQVQQMMQEDEELSQQVHLVAQMGGTESVSQEEANDMEMALAIFKSYQVELQGMRKDPEALANKRDLCSMFPDIDTDMLQAVLTANGNSLEKAIENINAQMQCALGKRPQTVPSPEALLKRGRYLLDQASQEHCKMGQKNRARASKFQPGVIVMQNPTESEAMRTVELVRKDYRRYRDWTDCFDKLRQSHRRSGKNYSRKKLTNIASFYSKLATLYTMLMDEANARAAACLEYLNAVRQDHNTIDLHDYRVKEALQAFDMFVDRHIADLNETGAKHCVLYAVTGRGVHSQDGVPRIRNAVEKRVTERGLQCGRANEGLLEVAVHSDSALTYTVKGNSAT